MKLIPNESFRGIKSYTGSYRVIGYQIESNIVILCNKGVIELYRLIQSNTESHSVLQGHEKSKRLLKNRYRFCQPFLRFMDPEIAPFLRCLDPEFFCPFLQFLGLETAGFLQFLDPETAPFLRFLDPEFFLSISTISGYRNCSIFAVSGSRNCNISTIS